jgi:nucleoid-associated protein YgaU
LRERPDSASAHWQLGILYFEELKDWPGALYHFDRYAKLQPKARPDLVKQLTDACRQELAKQVPLGNISIQLQREIADLLRTNATLRQELDQLRQLAAVPRPSTPEPRSNPATNPPPPTVQVNPPPAVEPQPPVSRPAPARRTYVIRPGDTLASIARAHGVSLSAMLEANPSVNPRRLQPGQVVQVPKP